MARLCLGVAMLAWPVILTAQSTVTARDISNGPSQTLTVPIFKSRVVDVRREVSRVSVGNPDIADILILRANRIYVLGKDLGTTNVLLWDRSDDLVATISVSVVHDLDDLKARLNDLLPEEEISVYAVQRSIVLAGEVSNIVRMEAAVRLAENYLQQVATATEAEVFEPDKAATEDKTGGEVINLMHVGGAQQVMLEVKVAEVDRTLLRRLNVQFNSVLDSSRWRTGGVNGGATFPDALFVPNDVRIPVFGGADDGRILGPVIDEFLPSDMEIQNQGLFASFLSNDFLFNMAIDAAKENNLAKILAEPTLTTLTGQEARFLSGGEFPIPVPGGLSGITIEFKEFGVGLRFLPVVLDSGRINLKINISVSELVEAASVTVTPDETPATFVIPALRKRSAVSTVELADGQTMGIAGLINEDLRELATRFPGLGDIPILGQLFRSQSFMKNETELVILVTPHLAKPIAPEDIRLPTDGLVEPGDWEYYFLGKMTDKPASGAPAGTTGGAEGEYGHTLD
jgi:pilus assembly protein CpaC